MKRLILGVALIAAVAACKAQSNNAVSSTEGPNVKSECCSTKADCGTKTDCSGAAKAECAAGKTCPVTGKTIN